MNQIENSPEMGNMEKKERIITAVTTELNSRLIDMGEISGLDKPEVEVIDRIRRELGRTSSYEKLEEEIPVELLKEYVKVMFGVEQAKLVKNLSDVYELEVVRPFLDRYEQAKALGVEVTVDPDVGYVLELPKKTN